MIETSLQGVGTAPKMFRLLGQDFKFANGHPKLSQHYFSIDEIVELDAKDLSEEYFVVMLQNRTRSQINQRKKNSIVKLCKYELVLNKKSCVVVVMKDSQVFKDLFFARQMVSLLKMLQATVSHDMISPLNLINMYGGLLEDMP